MSDQKQYLSLGDLSSRIGKLARKVRARKADLPAIGRTMDFAYPYIEINESGYNYVVEERGKELLREVSQDIDELLYVVFADVTLTIAMRYELEHRQTGVDSRRVYFAKQEELLGMINLEWKKRMQEKHSSIIVENPFDDHARERALLSKRLRDEGRSEKEAWESACRQYPLPHAI